MSAQQDLTLTEAVTMYLATLSPEQKQESQEDLNKFVRWYGTSRKLTEVTALGLDNYCKEFNPSVTDAERRLEPIRSFLSYAKKANLIEVSLASHVRVPKTKQKKQVARASSGAAAVTLTPEGYSALETELETLKAERPRIAEQLRLAAADKDFRENAPLEAARERQGQIEARIREIEAILKSSNLVEEKPRTADRIGVGSTVVVSELGTGEQECYTMVSPSEANPAVGKLSVASPIGKALLEQAVGSEVEVIAPAGKLRYRVEEIKS